MADKLADYQGWTGRVHTVRDGVREKFEGWRQEHPQGVRGMAMGALHKDGDRPPKLERTLEDYEHVYRRKTRRELIRVSAAVMGIEFSYAAETAFVSPTLLKIGVPHQAMTLVWGLSPLVGFFLTPLLGSLSDGCRHTMGRRRPFILILALGVFIGLLLVPNGAGLGHWLGDPYPPQHNASLPTRHFITTSNTTTPTPPPDTPTTSFTQPWGVLFTVLGTVLLDFDADACQSPARAYLLDVTLPEDHARGLSTFTIMAGLGGFFGYALGGINWDATAIGLLLGGHVRAVFSLITVLFLICVSYTITAFKEIPLDLLQQQQQAHLNKLREASGEAVATRLNTETEQNYGTTGTEQKDTEKQEAEEPAPSLQTYLKSIVFMPHSLRMVCLTNLFCWMAHVCYSLYFTDFVGEAVFNGDPKAPEDSESHDLYEQGVRFGCWGMSMYSLSCSCYSLIIEKLIRRFGARNVYVGGLLFYSAGMALMAFTKHKVGVILFSWTAGVMYSTLFTMPYLLVAHYHASGVFSLSATGEACLEAQHRGLGTDIAIVSSMVFLAQFILSICMGSIVSWSGTTTAVVSVASFLAFCGAASATNVMYLDL